MTDKTLAEMTTEIREINVAKGWRPAEGGPGENTWGDYAALLHSEVSEALEAYRDHRLADATAVEDCEGPVCDIHGHEPVKPEGVGSELADVLIRLLDMCDVFGIKVSYERLADVVEHRPVRHMGLKSFGDHLSALHLIICDAWREPRFLPVVLRTLVMVTRTFEIDLGAEYERKVAYNRGREFQHGGRTLAGEKDTQVTPSTTARYNALYMAIPTDPRDWWTSDETDEFLSQWERLGLPRLVLHDAGSESLMLGCSDVRKAAEMIGMADHVTNDESFGITRGSYEVCIVQAETKETKDA